MKKITRNILLLALISLSFSTQSFAKEVGLLLGGAIEVKDAADQFLLTPFVVFPVGPEEDGGSSITLPLTIGFGSSLPAGASLTTVTVTPTYQYDFPIVPKAFYVAPFAGPSFGYAHTSINIPLIGLNGDANTFNLGVSMGVEAKYVLKDKFVFRFTPIGFGINPFHYTDNGIGSDSTVGITYNISGGVSYRF